MFLLAVGVSHQFSNFCPPASSDIDLVLEARQTLKVDSSEWRMLDRQREDYLRKVVIMKGQSDRLMYLIQRGK